jgi:hypothetical protein
MFGENLSDVDLWKKEFPHVVFIKYSCHSMYLVASKVSVKLPKALEEMLSNVASHFSRSYSRQIAFKEFQESFEVESLKMVNPSGTRWLSLEGCISRVLGHCPELKAYFTNFVFDESSKVAEKVLETLQNPFTIIYLELWHMS